MSFTEEQLVKTTRTFEEILTSMDDLRKFSKTLSSLLHAVDHRTELLAKQKQAIENLLTMINQDPIATSRVMVDVLNEPQSRGLTYASLLLLSLHSIRSLTIMSHLI